MSSSEATRSSVFCSRSAGVMAWERPPHHGHSRLPQEGCGEGMGKAWGRRGEGQPKASVSPPGVPPATHLLRVKEPVAVQAQPPLLPAEAAQLPLEVLGRAGLWQSREPPAPPPPPHSPPPSPQDMSLP